MGSIPGSGRSPGEGNSNLLQYSCLDNPRTEKPGGLQSVGSQRVGHDRTSKHACTETLPRSHEQGTGRSPGTWGVKEKQEKTCASGRTQEDGDVQWLRVKAYDTETDLVKWKPFQNQRAPSVAWLTSRQIREWLQKKWDCLGWKRENSAQGKQEMNSKHLNATRKPRCFLCV